VIPDRCELELIDRWQHDFPLVPRPFDVAGRPVGLDEAKTIAAFERLRDTGALSRIGAVVRPHTVGASTLAAMRVSAGRLEQVAALVSREAFVNHNYERTHAFNLWFVIAGPDARAVSDTIGRIEMQTGLPVLDLPLLEAFHVDLGFPLSGGERHRRDAPKASQDYCPDALDRKLLSAIELGVPIVTHPYRQIACEIGIGEADVIHRLRRLAAAGIVTRFGCVVRHRALGYTANAMTVWDVPDARIADIVERFVGNPGVTLCYRRPRRLPDWPYNIFCMVHARTRGEAGNVVEALDAAAGAIPHDVLYSTRCFKQRGAVFSHPTGGVH
jgi:DNA-binding Lrp family transcriptional regulator